MENVKTITGQTLVEDAFAIMQAERNVFLGRMDKALDSWLGKSVLVSISGLVSCETYYDDFEHAYFARQDGETLLIFKNQFDDAYEWSVKLDDISCVVVRDNLDEDTLELGEDEESYAAECLDIIVNDESLNIYMELQ